MGAILFVTNKTGRVGVLFLTSDGRSSLSHSPGSVYNTRSEWWERQLSVIIFTFPHIIIHLRSISFRDRPSVLTENRRFFYPPCIDVDHFVEDHLPSTSFSWHYDRRACRATSPVLCHASVSDQCMSCLYLAERALEHEVNLLQQWRHRTSLQNLLLKILSIWTCIHCNNVNEFHVLFSL